MQQKLFNAGLRTKAKVETFITCVYDFLAYPPVPLKYVGAVTNNRRYIERSYRFEALTKAKADGDQKTYKRLSEQVAEEITTKSFEFMAQRVNSLASDEDGDFPYQDAFIVGDESAFTGKRIQSRQALAQAGLGQPFSNLERIVNRCWFGSSMHDPCLQIADWVAFVLRKWAERRPGASGRLKQIAHLFRGYPTRVFTRGLALWPDSQDFPSWPPWEHETVPPLGGHQPSMSYREV